MKKTLSILALVILLVWSCGDSTKESVSAIPEVKMETEKNNLALVKRLLSEGDNKNPSYLEEIGDPNYKYYLPSNGKPLGLQEHKQFWESVNISFPDLKHSVQEIFAVDDKVVARTIVRGTHRQEFAGIAATGASVEISQLLICRFANGKLIELREEVDLLGLYQQLGMELQPKR